MEQEELETRFDAIADQLRELLDQAQELAAETAESAQAAMSSAPAHSAGQDFLTVGLTVFVLACFIGYKVVWSVTPALHTPLMSVTNAISGIIVIGALLQISGPTDSLVTLLAFVAILISTINVAGGFLVTQRMLKMFRK